MKDYFKAWFAMLRRHPGVYIQATLNNIYSYNDPFHMGRGQQGVYRFYIDKMYQKKAGIDVSYVGPKKSSIYSGFMMNYGCAHLAWDLS